MKFALHNYGGKPVKFFTIEAQDICSNEAPDAPSHHIAILDVSGSMWGDLEAVKNIIEKVFTAEEFNDPSQKISLITYSSQGDVKVHFKRVTVEDVLAPNSPHLAEIRGLRVRGLTCMSQALVAAETLIDDSEATCISLHTDGYANDRSPYAEAQIIVDAVVAIEKHPNVFCNTVGYRSYCDFALLAAIANRLSGTSMQASNARDVYKALHSAQTLLAGSMSPVLEAGIGTYDFLTFVSKKGGKVLGSEKSIQVRGLASGDDATVYRYREVDALAYTKAPGPVCDGLTNPTPLLAFARAQIALGNLNAAKYAMVSTRNTFLIQQHSRALVASEVAAMGADIERHLYNDVAVALNADYGLGETGPSLLSVLAVLDKYRSSVRINVDTLLKTYTRRGLKKVPGTRIKEGDDKGKIEPVTSLLMTHRKVGDHTAQVASIDINRDTATVNIKTVEDGILFDVVADEAVAEIEGIQLDLKSFRNYTIVGDGQVNVPVLPLRLGDKRCFAALLNLGVVTGDFDPKAQYDIAIGDMPLVDYDQNFANLDQGVFLKLSMLTVLQKLFAGLTAGESEALTTEQVAALKAHYITPALYFSPPTCTPYTNLVDAQNRGEVDTYLSYKVKIGTPDIINLGKIKSGNAFLQRHFTLTEGDGTVVKKPTLKDWWGKASTWGLKKLSARTKLDATDELGFPIYAGFFGLGDDTYLHNALQQAGVDWDNMGTGLDRDARVEAFKSILAAVNQAIDTIYAKSITPLAFYVGATGLVPDSFGAVAMTADQLTKAHPDVKLAKAEKEGTFYEVAPGLLLSVFVKGVHFSTERGVKAASALKAS